MGYDLKADFNHLDSLINNLRLVKDGRRTSLKQDFKWQKKATIKNNKNG